MSESRPANASAAFLGLTLGDDGWGTLTFEAELAGVPVRPSLTLTPQELEKIFLALADWRASRKEAPQGGVRMN